MPGNIDITKAQVTRQKLILTSTSTSVSFTEAVDEKGMPHTKRFFALLKFRGRMKKARKM